MRCLRRPLPFGFLVLLLATGGCVLPRQQPVATAPADDRTAGVRHAYPLETLMGLCEDYPEESRTLERAVLDLEQARNAGAGVLRIAFGWDAIEREPGVYDWSFWDEFVRLATEEYHLQLIPYVCYTPDWAASEPGDESWRSPPRDPADFENFMAVISARYARWIDSWELWNEPDNAAYWSGDAAAFAELTAAGSRGVRRGDPEALVVLGGLAWDLDFLRELLEEHQVAPWIDVVNIHSYFETWHEDPIEMLAAYLEEAALLVHAFGESEPLWMAEVGYSSRGLRPGVRELYRARYRNEHTVEYQAAALARTVLVSLGSGRLSLFAWYRINDLPVTQDVIGDDHNRHLGIVDAGGRPKPALETLQWLSDRFAQPYRISGREFLAAAADGTPVEMRAFTLADGRRLLAVWLRPEMDPGPGAELTEDRRRTEVKVTAVQLDLVPTEVAYAPERAAPSGVRAEPAPSGPGTVLHIPIAGSEVAMLLLE